MEEIQVRHFKTSVDKLQSPVDKFKTVNMLICLEQEQVQLLQLLVDRLETTLPSVVTKFKILFKQAKLNSMPMIKCLSITVLVLLKTFL